MYTTAAGFKVYVENVDLGPHASTARTLPAELSLCIPVYTFLHNLCPALSVALNLFGTTFSSLCHRQFPNYCSRLTSLSKVYGLLTTLLERLSWLTFLLHSCKLGSTASLSLPPLSHAPTVPTFCLSWSQHYIT